MTNENDLIRRADAIAFINSGISLDTDADREYATEMLKNIPSAEAKGRVISAEKLKRMKFVVIKGDKTEEAYRTGWNGAIDCVIGEYASAEAVQGWIQCSERLPEDLEAVNVTWVNHNPPVYYQYTKDVPNADTAVYYRGVWYWWDSTICDVLGEYGEKCGAEQIDKDIEILAWMPLPTPYKGGDSE